MKKILALTLTGLLVLGGSGMALSATAQTDNSPATQAEATATEQKLYLVPGTYTAGGAKVANTIPTGATKLTDEECAGIYTENAYLCNLSAGAALPKPATKRVDKDGKGFVFNGWWTIVDATVTYFDKVPTLSETTYLYADWRAVLSQPKDPIIPEGVVEVEPVHYLMIKHKDGTTDRIVMRKDWTDQTSAETLGYKYAVQLTAIGFQLAPEDVITVYTTGLSDSEKPVITPLVDSANQRHINLEAAGDGNNDTANYLSKYEGTQRSTPYLTYIGEETRAYNMYIKYYSKGTIMAVYLEPQA